MTADAFSDLVLMAVCAVLAWRSLGREQPHAGIGVACVLIGAAALLGVFRFSEWDSINATVKGAHQFASLVAAVGAFPIWALSLAHPLSPITAKLAGAGWVSFVAAGLGVAVVVLGFKPWQQVVPLLCGLWIAHTVMVRWQGARRWRGVAGVLCLFGSFAAALLIPTPTTQVLGLFNKTQLLHYLLAAALLLTCLRFRPANSSD